MNLKALSDFQLHEQTRSCAKREQQAALELLAYLYEVNRRCYFAAKGYRSLYDYIHRELGFSEGAASDRVAAMRLAYSVPEALVKLQEGQLSISGAAKIQRHIRFCEKTPGTTPSAASSSAASKDSKYQFDLSTTLPFSPVADSMGASNTAPQLTLETPLPVKFSPEEKAALVLQVSGHSTRETEKILLADAIKKRRITPAQLRPESARSVTPELTEVKFLANTNLMKQIERVRELKGDLGVAEIFAHALQSYLESHDPLKKLEKQEAKKAKTTEHVVRAEASGVNTHDAASTRTPVLATPSTSTRTPVLATPSTSTRTPASGPKHPSRYIPTETRRAVWLRSRGRCEWKDEKTARRCESRYRLQYEHRVPFALEGGSEPGNIEHLCFSHNQRRAVEVFGANKMDRYRSPQTVG